MNLFNQYTWGDFFKVVGSLTLPYYLFVGVAYYREDFGNWLSRLKGKKEESPVEVVEEEEPEDELYEVRNYEPITDQTVKEAEPVGEEPEAEDVADLPPAPVVGEEVNEIIAPVPIFGEASPVEEQPLDEIIAAAERVVIDAETETIQAPDAADTSAVNLSDIFNSQKGLSSDLAGIQFNR